MTTQPDVMPVARVFFLGSESIYPGWYVQTYVEAELRTTRLEIDEDAEAYEAVTEAAGYLGCAREQIQLEGVPWPKNQ